MEESPIDFPEKHKDRLRVLSILLLTATSIIVSRKNIFDYMKDSDLINETMALGQEAAGMCTGSNVDISNCIMVKAEFFARLLQGAGMVELFTNTLEKIP